MKKYIKALDRAYNDLISFLDIIEKENIDVIDSTRKFIEKALNIDLEKTGPLIYFLKEEENKSSFVIRVGERSSFKNRGSSIIFRILEKDGKFSLDNKVAISIVDTKNGEEKPFASKIAMINTTKETSEKMLNFGSGISIGDASKLKESNMFLTIFKNTLFGSDCLLDVIGAKNFKKLTFRPISFKVVDTENFIFRMLIRGILNGEDRFNIIFIFNMEDDFDFKLKYMSIKDLNKR